MAEPRKKIMIVDDNMTNLTVGKNALIGKYDVLTIPSGAKLLKMLEKITPDLILLDVEMPEMNGYEVIKHLKENPKTSDIPVVFLTGKVDTGSELEGLSLGAIDYIAKPFSPPLLEKRIEVHLLVAEQKKELASYNENLQEMVREKTKKVMDLQNAILKIVAELVECRDDVTGGHIERTQEFLKVLILELAQSPEYGRQIMQWDLELLIQSSQLHDLGKIAIKDSVLSKPGRLTDEEYETMKWHTTFGVKVIERIERETSEEHFLEHAKIFAGTHHEKWDGSGYPNGLVGEEIPLQGRLMALVDVYDALISKRPYKKPFTHEEALKIICDGRGTHFDPDLVDAFEKAAGKIKEASTSIFEAQESKTSILA